MDRRSFMKTSAMGGTAAATAAARASRDLLASIRESGDPLTRKTANSFFAARDILRGKTESADLTYLEARQKYL